MFLRFCAKDTSTTPLPTMEQLKEMCLAQALSLKKRKTKKKKQQQQQQQHQVRQTNTWYIHASSSEWRGRSTELKRQGKNAPKSRMSEAFEVDRQLSCIIDTAIARGCHQILVELANSRSVTGVNKYGYNLSAAFTGDPDTSAMYFQQNISTGFKRMMHSEPVKHGDGWQSQKSKKKKSKTKSFSSDFFARKAHSGSGGDSDENDVDKLVTFDGSVRLIKWTTDADKPLFHVRKKMIIVTEEMMKLHIGNLALTSTSDAREEQPWFVSNGVYVIDAAKFAKSGEGNDSTMVKEAKKDMMQAGGRAVDWAMYLDARWPGDMPYSRADKTQMVLLLKDYTKPCRVGRYTGGKLPLFEYKQLVRQDAVIYVQTPDMGTTTLHIDDKILGEETILGIKQRMQDMHDALYPLEQQRILLGGRGLDDGKTLSEYNLSSDATLTLRLVPPLPSSSPSTDHNAGMEATEAEKDVTQETSSGQSDHIHMSKGYETNFYLLVGNTVKQCEDEQYRWTLFVEVIAGSKNSSNSKGVTAASLVEKVDVQLHKSFKKNKFSIRNTGLVPAFQLTRKGWGSFEIPLVVHFKSVTQREPLAFTHTLTLDQNSRSVYNIFYGRHDAKIKEKAKGKGTSPLASTGFVEKILPLSDTKALGAVKHYDGKPERGAPRCRWKLKKPADIIPPHMQDISVHTRTGTGDIWPKYGVEGTFKVPSAKAKGKAKAKAKVKKKVAKFLKDRR